MGYLMPKPVEEQLGLYLTHIEEAKWINRKMI